VPLVLLNLGTVLGHLGPYVDRINQYLLLDRAEIQRLGKTQGGTRYQFAIHHKIKAICYAEWYREIFSMVGWVLGKVNGFFRSKKMLKCLAKGHFLWLIAWKPRI